MMAIQKPWEGSARVYERRYAETGRAAVRRSVGHLRCCPQPRHWHGAMGRRTGMCRNEWWGRESVRQAMA